MSSTPLFTQIFGEKGPDGTLVFLHATGLNGSAYRPLVEALEFDGQVIVPTLRGHGRTTLPADALGLTTWDVFADDITRFVGARRDGGPLVLAGHSAGAVTALLAARNIAPDLLLMIEPVVVPTVVARLARTPLRHFTTRQLPIARRAAARRTDFASREAALAAYRAKPFFASWHEDALRGYVGEGFHDTKDGVTLACRPDWESAMFGAQGHGFWPHLKHVCDRKVPVSILAAEKATTFPLAQRARAGKLGARLTEEKGSHMLPLEDPQGVAAWMRANLLTSSLPRV
ncbi:alpha/beta fold hydrolase [Parvularcula lutaonensis]|uniref:Alpha/beta fold hydrolase n=1 Tax=Parvularcula lutaonensis TaxID=491923 RepID=A0ABV7M973_9PROT|nr:alpha/beta hydrolase [Parvularcula lutaonensis]GGY41417.1 alpha/beta hydrolase [Parvularcula lutaonensis]